MKLFKTKCLCNMGVRINKFLCKRLGHEWNKPEIDDPNIEYRVCERCGRTEKGFIFTNENKEMDVRWELYNGIINN